MTFVLPKFTVDGIVDKQANTVGSLFIGKGISSSGFKKCWSENLTGKNIIVAIIDTGIDRNHRDLRGKIIKSFNLTGEPLSEDHGTHVAGIIAANGWMKGGAYDSKLIDIKVLGRNGGTIDNVVNGINLAVNIY